MGPRKKEREREKRDRPFDRRNKLGCQAGTPAKIHAQVFPREQLETKWVQVQLGCTLFKLCLDIFDIEQPLQLNKAGSVCYTLNFSFSSAVSLNVWMFI